MSMTGLDVFDTTIHKTNTWLNDLAQELGGLDRHRSYLAMRVTLHALRDRLLRWTRWRSSARSSPC